MVYRTTVIATLTNLPETNTPSVTCESPATEVPFTFTYTPVYNGNNRWSVTLDMIQTGPGSSEGGSGGTVQASVFGPFILTFTATDYAPVIYTVEMNSAPFEIAMEQYVTRLLNERTNIGYIIKDTEVRNNLSTLDNNAVKLNGNQTINDVKTFTSPIPIDTSADDGRVVTKLENITLGTDPTINAYGGFKTVDSNDVQFANCNCSYSTTGKIGCNFWVSRSDSGTAVSGALGIYIDKNGTSAYTQAPTPDVSANNTEIATTAYINTKFQVVSTLPASPDANTYYFIPAS